MNINYNIIFKSFIPFVFIVLLSYLIASIVYILLPSKAYIYENNVNDTLEFKRYNINNVFKEKIKKVTKQKIQKKQDYQILKNIHLLAIYDMGEKNGYIILQENNKQDTLILSRNEKFKEYKLSITEDKNDLKYDLIEEENNIQTTKSISIDGDLVTVKRELINNYIQNFDKIWNDISISDVKDKNGIVGFKVSRIKKNTPFAKIGLRKNDIIKSINNIELKSYNDAFKIYKKINKIKNLNIKILRDNIETEIYYEIK